MSRETLGDTLLVARLYLLRAWRRALDNPRTLALRVGFLVALWLYIVLGDAGQPPSEIEPETLRELLRGAAAGAWLLFAVTAAAGTPTAARSVQGSPFLLRSVGLRPTLWGTVLGTYARRLAIFSAFGAATALALLWGLDAPARNPLLFLVLLVFSLSAELAGMAARLAVAAADITPGGAGKVLLGGVGVTALSLAAGYPEETIVLLSRLPVAAFGEVFAAGVPGVEPNRTLVAAATAGGVAGSLALALTVEQLALRSWFTGGSRERVDTERTRIDDLLGRVGVTGPTRAVAWRLWLQSRRRPLVVGLLAVPTLIVGLALVDPEGTDIPLFPLVVGAYAVWMATVAVGLNPLSSEDDTLPHLLSASGTEIVRGYALTTVLIGAPVIVASVLLAGALVGPVWLTVPALLLSLLVLVGVVPAALAIGFVLPQVGALEQTVDGPIAPGKFAILAHSVVLCLLAAPAALSLLFADSLPLVAVFAGIGVTVLAAPLVGVISLRVAAGRLDGMTLG
jgi:hypothetical protein